MRHTHSILIVDDDTETRTALARFLVQCGFLASRARSGREALRRLRERRRTCLILLDLMMRGMTGWEFLEYHRSDRALSSIPLVLVTGWLDTDLAQAKAMVPKPVDPPRLLRTLRPILRQEERRRSRPQLRARA